MSLRIYTKTGDAGQTGLFGGARVPKDHLRVEAYGTVDELNAALGLARALGASPAVDAVLARVQALLFELGAQLATAPAKAARGPAGLSEEDVSALERDIDEAEAHLTPLASFVLPAGGPVASALHVARGVCRRAERRCVTLSHEDPEGTVLAIKFLNRLGDLLFVLARRANHEAGHGDVPWRARRERGADRRRSAVLARAAGRLALTPGMPLLTIASC